MLRCCSESSPDFVLSRLFRLSFGFVGVSSRLPTVREESRDLVGLRSNLPDFASKPLFFSSSPHISFVTAGASLMGTAASSSSLFSESSSADELFWTRRG